MSIYSTSHEEPCAFLLTYQTQTQLATHKISSILTRRKHWPSPGPLSFTRTFAASPLENRTFIGTK